MDSCNDTNKANSQTPKVEIRTRQKLCYFCRCGCKSEAILSEKFRPGYPRAVMFVWENFHLGYRDLGSKNRVLGNRTSPASHVNILKF